MYVISRHITPYQTILHTGIHPLYTPLYTPFVHLYPMYSRTCISMHPLYMYIHHIYTIYTPLNTLNTPYIHHSIHDRSSLGLPTITNIGLYLLLSSFHSIRQVFAGPSLRSVHVRCISGNSDSNGENAEFKIGFDASTVSRTKPGAMPVTADPVKWLLGGTAKTRRAMNPLHMPYVNRPIM